jgi:hypothetical protein
MFVAYFWAFNRRYKKFGCDYSIYFYSIDHQGKQSMSPLVGPARKNNRSMHTLGGGTF